MNSTADKLAAALRAMYACHRAFSSAENWTVLDEEARAAADAALAVYEAQAAAQAVNGVTLRDAVADDPTRALVLRA